MSIAGLMCQLVINPVLAQSQKNDRCRVVTITETQSTMKIQKYDNLNRSVQVLPDGRLQCNVMFNALIGGQYHPASATVAEKADSTYVCNRALQTATADVKRRVAGEKLSSRQHMVCDDNNTYTPNTSRRATFTYKGFKCAYFDQTIEQGGKLFNINKPACLIGPGQWVGIENW